MRQHAINLLSDSVRARSQAAQRQGRYLLCTIVGVMVVAVLCAHSRLMIARGRHRLAEAEQRAAHALALERQAAQLQGLLGQRQAFIGRYAMVAAPLRMSDVLATVSNQLPESVTLELIHLDAARRKPARSPRERSPATVEQAPRVLRGELSGFAASDAEVAEVVDRLAALPPLEAVTLDFSRTRTVRGRPAREFRLSFRIDLERPYHVTTIPQQVVQTSLEEAP